MDTPDLSLSIQMKPRFVQNECLLSLTNLLQKIVDWFMAIRAAKLHHLQIAFPTTSIRDLSKHLTRDFKHEGFLYKTGPRVGDAYRKRYFVLDDRKLMYLDHPLVSRDPHPSAPFSLT